MNPMDHMGIAVGIAKGFCKYRREPPSDSDIYSEAFVGLVIACQTYRPDLGIKFSVYAYPVIIRRITEFLRRERCRKRWIPIQGVDRGKGVPEIAAPEIPSRQYTDRSVQSLYSAIDELDEVRRQVCLLRTEGRSFEEIGESLGFSKQNAHRIYKEAIERLRESIESSVIDE